MRTRQELRDALYRASAVAHTEGELANKVANVILGEIDEVFVKAWSDLSDMGITRAQMQLVKKAVKKRM